MLGILAFLVSVGVPLGLATLALFDCSQRGQRAPQVRIVASREGSRCDGSR